MTRRTHAGIDAAMRAALDASPALAGLRARGLDDPAVALIDAWAVALDVLSFYQERIAVEGFLGTATEERSIRELADAVGYRPSPGLSAGCLLAFTLEDGVGAPPSVVLDAGLKVQSLPGPGELPQTYETGATVQARPEWNAVPAMTAGPATPGETELFLPGVVTDLRPGDALLFLSAEREQGDLDGDWTLRFVDTVAPLPGGGPTRVTWREPVSGEPRVYALRQRAAVFGHNAPDWRSMPLDLQLAYLGVTKIPSGGVGLQWPKFTLPAPAAPTSVDLDAVYPAATEGGWAVLVGPNAKEELYQIVSVSTTGRANFTLTAKVTRLALSGPDLAKNFADAVRETVVLVGSQRLTPAPRPISAPVEGRAIRVAGLASALPAGRQVIATGRPAWLAVADDVFTVELQPAGRLLRPGELLRVTAPATPRDAGGNRVWPVLADDGTAGTVVGTDAQLRSAPAPDTAAPVAEPAVVTEPVRADTVTLAAPLAHAYDRASFRLLANVAPASHGETRQQVLGSGDAGTALQSFLLSIPPDPFTGRAQLTYVRSAEPGGAASTLAVVVNGVRWREVPSLLGAGPRDQVYVVGADPDGRIQVRFGDGHTGARLPSGTDNVTATYRAGIGLPGMMGAGRITLLLTRPLGVRSVTNPLPTDLAADPEPVDDTRRGAPRTALTLDRVVSLVDYAEAARSFAGIAKAQARWAWEGEVPVVRLSVAGAGGLAVDETTRGALATSLTAAGDPFQRVRVYSYTPVRVGVTALVVAAPGVIGAPVRSAVETVLRDTFSIDRRDFDQPLTASEVEAAIQAVDGVLGVAAITLDPLVDTGGGGAELHTIDPDRLAITVQESR